jgi:iron complex outermembrane receptor protein
MRMGGYLAALAGSTAIIAVASPAYAQTSEYNISAGPLKDALDAYARQSGRPIIYRAEDVRGVRSPGYKGTAEPAPALAALLANTGFVTRSGSSGAVAVVRAGNVVGSVAEIDNGPDSGTQGNEIVVTGTNVRGQAPVGSSVTTVSRDQMEARGFSTVSDALRATSQASTLGPNEGATSGLVQNSNLNIGRGTGVNLRGLGVDATLVLLNGRRLAPSAGGALVDVTAIPLSLIDRVEILPDGASAIYGSDAIGGVVNIITRSKMEGIRVEGDVSLADGYDVQRGALAAGLNWSSGGIVVGSEYRRSSALKAIDRDFVRSDLTSIGGPDVRSTICAPGTITAGGVTYAIPAGQNGVGLQASSLTPRTSARCESLRDGDISPTTERWSLTAHLNQQIGSDLKVYGDLLLSDRRSVFSVGGARASITVNRGTPFFVDFGSTVNTQTVTYDLKNDLGLQTSLSKTTALGSVAGFDAQISQAWHVGAYYAYTEARDGSFIDNLPNTFYLNRAAALTDPLTAFNPFGSGGTNATGTVNSFRGWTDRRERTNQNSAHFGIDGSLFELTGAGPIRIAAGLDYLKQTYSVRSVSFLSAAAPTNGAPTNVGRNVTSVYGELVLPLVSPDMSVPGIRRVLLSGAVRRDDYNDFGSTTNPKVGIEWEVFDGLRLTSSWGTSFKAPLLLQLNPLFPAFVSVVTDPTSSTGRTNALLSLEGVRPLQPETARSFTLGVQYKSPTTNNLQLSLNYFDVDYKNRITIFTGQVTSFLTQEAIYSDFITRNPTAAQISSILANPNLQAPFVIPAGGIGAILNYGYRNVSSTQISGIDFTAGYDWNLTREKFSLSLNGTAMLSYKSALTQRQPVVDQIGNIYFPSKLKANAAISYSTDSLVANLAINYLSGYDNTSVTPIQSVPAWTTADLTVRHAIKGLGFRQGKDLWLSLSVRNLADKEPPAVFGLGYGYDGFTHDPIGRLVTLGIRVGF